jgi:hypothetical protein
MQRLNSDNQQRAFVHDRKRHPSTVLQNAEAWYRVKVTSADDVIPTDDREPTARYGIAAGSDDVETQYC